MTKLPYRQIHLDFHTPKLSFELAKNFDKQTFQKTLSDASVNSITLTGRCHHGHIYYDTKLPARHPNMRVGRDFLVEEIDACHEIGVRCPIYLTVGWDAYSATHHPEWLERKENGEMYGFEDFGQLSPGWKTLCFNSPYLDYLQEQIIDCMTHLGEKLDGLFFDIVWQDSCSCNYCIQKMLERNFDPTNEQEKKEFAKETEEYLKKTIYETVHSMNPDCPIFFNGGNIEPEIREDLPLYSHLEIESLPSGNWGYQHFPTVVRYAKNLGKEYVGMTGKFHKSWADFGSYKNQAALQYESFLALAHGAKCSIGDQMYPDGTLQKTTYQNIGNVYGTVKELEQYSAGSVALAEIAIIHPNAVVETSNRVDLSLAGAVNMLNEADYQFDIVDFESDFSKYRLLVLPDKVELSKMFSDKLEQFIGNGGKVLASYRSGLSETKEFPTNWGISLDSFDSQVPTYSYFEAQAFPTLPKEELVMHGRSANVRVTSGKEIAKKALPLFERNYLHYYSHFQAPVGEETDFSAAVKTKNIGYIAYPVFEMYKQQGVYFYKRMVLDLLSDLLENEKICKTTLPSTADVVMNYQPDEERVVVHLLHYIPEHRSLTIDTIEETIPLYHSKIEIDMKEVTRLTGADFAEISIKDVTNEKSIPFEIEENKLKFEVPELNGYSVFTINQKGK
ncbi:MAG: beta-galactosidase trimerization domain-containing protein [Lactobacillales bacterium]|jgi:hypothetical protein|nr:beta-galactosidase trimerization domain-containing protein [Lactobacillales bacterium]